MDPELYYPLFDQGTMQYIPNGQTSMVTKKFPIPYVKLDGETKDGIPSGGSDAGMPQCPQALGRAAPASIRRTGT